MKRGQKNDRQRIHSLFGENDERTAIPVRHLRDGLAERGLHVGRQHRPHRLHRGYAEIPTKGKIRRIYFCDSLRSEEVLSYFSTFGDNDFLFPNRFKKQITTRGIAQQLANYAHKYGINEKIMHPHSFRHFFAVEFLKRDNDISLLADLMGHSSINTTAIYLRLSKQQQIERLNKAMNF